MTLQRRSMVSILASITQYDFSEAAFALVHRFARDDSVDVNVWPPARCSLAHKVFARFATECHDLPRKTSGTIAPMVRNTIDSSSRKG
jgi:hypothetical protein